MNPYESLGARSFWKLGVADHTATDIPDLWRPKYRIGKKHKIATYGSCFAQHFSKSLRKRGFSWLCTEPAPEGLSEENSAKFNYEVFSTRTGNIYTVSLLRQWLSWAFETARPPATEVWEKEGRFYDPFRPRVEPNGFATPQEVIESREVTIKAFRASVEQADIFVFTLGLTESWISAATGYEYPMCPGTVAGIFDAENHHFVNQTTELIKNDLEHSTRILREANPNIRVLLTVSPVPLTATMTEDHVLVATTWSKSVLRAVAGEAAQTYDWVDYFPSYEIITSPVFTGRYFAENLRSVRSAGVDHVMKNFFQGQRKLRLESGGEVATDTDAAITNAKPGKRAVAKRKRAGQRKEVQQVDELVCEEELLAAFARKSKG